MKGTRRSFLKSAVAAAMIGVATKLDLYRPPPAPTPKPVEQQVDPLSAYARAMGEAVARKLDRQILASIRHF